LRRAFALTAALAALAAGCGGGDDGGGGEPLSKPQGGEPLSKPQYVARAEAICAQGDARLSAALQKEFPAGPPASKAAVEHATADIIVPALSGEVSRLRRLPPPRGDEQRVGAIYDAIDSSLEAIKADPNQTIVGDPFAKPQALADAYGLKKCGSS
jgi:hypothetical protein